MELHKEYWDQALDILESKLNRTAYNTWITKLEPVNIIGNNFVVKTEMPIVRDMIERKYISEIEEALTFINNSSNLKLKVILNGETFEPEINDNNNKDNFLANANFRLENGLMPRYTLNNFVVGKNNQMAHAAAYAVSQNPGTAYNPLFLYGGVGLGKTHLMHAIGNEVMKNNPNAKIIYVSCETFMNELITAIRYNNNDDKSSTLMFRQKYRELDLLLLDDIQFISDKKTTQEEFFFTFNDLWQNGKQIVITADRPPSEMKILTDRLSSRLAGGITIDIGLPDYETKMAILRAKTESQGVEISDEVLTYIAETVNSNIREMEGALTTVIAYSKLTGSNKTIDTDLAMLALKDKVGSSKPEVNVDYIQTVVSNYFSFTPEDLCSKKKTKDLALARQIAMYLSRKLLNDETFVSIGKKFGGRDHSTVIHAVELIGQKMEESIDFESTVTDIEKIITGK